MKKIVLLFLLVISMQLWGKEINGNYSNFLSHGSAHLYGNEVIITPNKNNRAGAGWSREVFDLNKNFHLEYEINLGNRKIEAAEKGTDLKYTDSNGNIDIGADGMVFVLKPSGFNDPMFDYGFDGGDIGYGLKYYRSFGVKFDTYTNPTLSDPAYNEATKRIDSLTKDHIAFVAKGQISVGINSGLDDQKTYKEVEEMEDGKWHTVTLDWDAQNKIFTYTFDGHITDTYYGDIITQYLGRDNKAYFGFTASTGSWYNVQKLRNVRVKATIPDEDYKLDIKKEAIDEKNYRAGEAVKYRITITNHGSDPLFDIRLADAKDLKIKDIDDINGINDFNGVPGTSDVHPYKGEIWKWTRLEPGQSIITTATKTITQTEVDNKQPVTRIATVGARMGSASGEAIFASDKKSVNLDVINGLKAEKNITDGDNYSKVGDIIKYKFTLENTGSLTLKNISVVDRKIPGVTIKVLNPKIPGFLSPGETAEGIGEYSVTQEDVDRGNVVNTANYRAVDPSDNELGESATAIAHAIKLSIEKTVDAGIEKIANKDEMLNYSIVVTNDSNIPVKGAVLTDLLESDFFKGQTAQKLIVTGSTHSGDLKTGLTLDEIKANDKVTVTFQTKADYSKDGKGTATSGELITNKATLKYGTDTIKDDATINIETFDITKLKVEKTVDAGVDRIANKDEMLNYSIVVTNDSNIPVKGAVLTDLLESDFFKGQTAQKLIVTGSTHSGDLKTGLTLDEIKANDKVTVTFQTKADYSKDGKGTATSGELITNKATLKYGTDTIKDDATINIETFDITKLKVEKTVDAGVDRIANKDEMLNYSIVVTNDSNIPVKGAVLTDLLESDFFKGQTAQKLIVTGSTHSGDLKTGLTLDEIKANDKVTVTFQMKADYSKDGKGTATSGELITNEATLKYGTDTIKDDATINIETFDITKLKVEKTVDAGVDRIANKDEMLNYSIVVTNDSNIPVKGAVLTDLLESDFFKGQTAQKLIVTGSTHSGDLKTGLTLDEIKANDKVTVTFQMKADYSKDGKGTATSRELITNEATLKYGTDTIKDDATINIETFDITKLKVEKTVDAGVDRIANKDEMLNYSIVVTNDSNIPVKGAVLTDLLESDFFKGQTAQKLIVTGSTHSGDLKTGLTLDEIKANDKVTVTFQMKADYSKDGKGTATSGELITNKATLKYGTDTIKDDATINIETFDITKLKVEKTVDAGVDRIANKDEMLNYSIVVTNDSSIPVKGAVLTDLLESDFFKGQTAQKLIVTGSTHSGDLKTGLTLDEIKANDKVTVTFQMKADYSKDGKGTATSRELITNEATLKYGTDTIKDDATINIETFDITKLKVEKTVDAGVDRIANKDEMLNYSIVVTNDSNIPVKGAVLTDLLESDFFKGQTAQKLIVTGSTHSGDLKTGLTLDEIKANDKVTVTFQMKADYSKDGKGTATSGELITNEATLKYGTDTIKDDATINIETFDITKLKVEKTVDAGVNRIANKDEMLNYSIVVTNDSNIPVKGAVLTDLLESDFFKGQTAQKLIVTGSTHSGDLKTGLTLDEIKANDKVTVTFQTKADYSKDGKGTATSGELITNKATLKYGTDTIKDDATINIETFDITKLKVEKTVDAGVDRIANKDEMLNYSIVVTNDSNIPVKGAVLTDLLESDFFKGQTAQKLIVTGSTHSGDLKTGLTLDEIKANDKVTVTFQTKADYSKDGKGTATSGELITNKATLKYGTDTIKDDATINIETFDITKLKVEKTVDAGVDRIANKDEMLNYSIVVTNDSNIPVKGAVLTDLLESDFFKGQTAQKLIVTGSTHSGDLKTGLTLDEIKANDKVTVTFQMKADYPIGTNLDDKVENIATLIYNSDSLNSNKVSLPIQKLIATDLDIKLQVEDLGGDGYERGDGIVDDGEKAEYTISITNPTPVNALNVLVSDDYKGLYLYKNDSYKYVSFDGGKLTGKDLKEGVILPEIKAGETIKLKFMVGFSYEGKNVDQDDTIPNEAYLSLQETSPLKKLMRAATPINKSSNKVVLKVAKPTYTLSKEIRNKKDEFYPGDIVIYDITLENTSAVIGKNIKIEDKVSEIKAFESWTWERGTSKILESRLKTSLRKDLSENGIELLAGETKRYTVVGRLKDTISKGEVKNTVKAGENLELQAEATLKVKDAQIKVTKTAKKKWVSIGDLISYKITVQNLSGNKGTVLKNLSLKDMMPPGFKYAEGSGKVDGNDADEDLRGRTIYFNNLELIGDKKIEITYILRIGTGVKPGSYKNKAWIENTSGKNLSNIGEASVEVINDPLFNSTVIIGKVFHDRDNDGWQDDANAYDIRVQTLSSQDNYLDGSVKKGDEEWRISSESKELLLGNLDGRGDESERSQKVILRRRIKDPKKIGDILIKSKEGSSITLKSTGEVLRNHSGNRNLTGVDLKVVRRVIKDPKYREELKDVKSLKKVRIENFIEPIYFDSAYANIRDGENEKLKQYLEKLSNKKNLKLVIVGYTDSQRPSKKAKFKNNHELSIARANTLKDYLSMKLDLSEEMFVIEGKGPKNPKGSNRTSSGRQLNRRTEIVIEYDEKIMKQIPLKVDESDYFEEVEVRNDGILEEGIPGVRLATVEGLVIETDQFGRYHVDGIDDIPDRGKNFIIKVDKVTLPSGTEFTTENPRVKTLTKVMEKFNFGVKIPKVKRRVKEKEIKVRVGSVFFPTDKWNVREDQIDNLKKISSLLTEYRGGVIVVEGNTDSRASNKYNEILALKRAKSIGKELEKIMGKDMISNVKIVTDLSGGER